jgi:hypothetical protein
MSTEDPFYPPLPETVHLPLKVAIQHTRANSAYLDNPNCPYPQKIKDLLREIAGSKPGGAGEVETTFLEPGADSFEAMLKELDRLYTDLKAFRNTVGTMEPNEKATFFKTTMSLLEKIATLKGSIYNMKEMADFQKTVITVMEQHLNPEDHKQIIEALHGYLR